MFKKIIVASSCLLLIITVIGSPLHAQAADPIINPDDPAYDEGSYTLDNIMVIIIKASGWVLGIVGSLALLMFIYGGFMFLISAGSSEKIGQAQKILVAAVIGLIIVFASYLIIKFVLASLGLNWNGEAKVMTPLTANTSITSDKKTCADLGQSYSCMNKAKGKNCQANLCLDGTDKADLTIQCCQPAN